MKREYNTILDDADSANRNNFVPSQSFTWCSPGNFNFSRWPIASPQTSVGVLSSRIHFSPKWMRDKRTPKDVCGEARWPITKCYLLRRALISNTDFFFWSQSEFEKTEDIGFILLDKSTAEARRLNQSFEQFGSAEQSSSTTSAALHDSDTWLIQTLGLCCDDLISSKFWDWSCFRKCVNMTQTSELKSSFCWTQLQ